MIASVAEQLPLIESDISHERKSFDVLASVNMMQFDVEHFGAVLPETRQRVRDEELSLLVEGVDRAAKTTFVLRTEGNDVVYFDKGKWRSYTGMLMTGKEVAQEEAKQDYRRKFLLDEAMMHLSKVYEMRKLRPGEQMVWASPYSQDVEDAYGAAFLRSCGRFPERKMGFIYRAFRNPAGDIVLESQTVDRSNAASFRAVHRYATTQPGAEMEQLVSVYDTELTAQTGNNYFAGRLEAERNENAWETLLAQTDLIEYMLSKLEVISARNVSRSELEEQTKRHMYGVWATFKKRIDGESVQYYNPNPAQQYIPAVHIAMLEYEVARNFNEFVAQGRVMVGCGGSISILDKDNVMSADSADVFSSIFGSKESDADCDYISKACPMCGTKNVSTMDKKIAGNRRRISGNCGCSMNYTKK